MYASEQGVLNGQWNAAEAAFQAEVERMRPFVLLRPSLFADGDMWCALYGEDIASGVAGFGPTPDDASREFDKAWMAAKTPAAMLAARNPTGARAR